MKKQLLLFVFILLSMMANATVTIYWNGVYYNLIDKGKTAEVIQVPNPNRGEYKGNVVISSTVTFEDVTYNVTSIKGGAFRDCKDLTSVTIPNSVTSIGERAFYYSGLTSITISNSVTSIREQTFAGCKSLTSVTIPNSVTSIESEAFSDCSGLTSVTIPNGVTSIGDQAFRCCYDLTSVTIGNGVTSIGDQAFAYCYDLTSVTIGNGVTSIGDQAFYNCYVLTDLYCYAEKVPTSRSLSELFGGTPVYTATLHVPAASIDAYKAADQWKEFGTIVALTPEGTGVKPITATENPSDRKFMDPTASSWRTDVLSSRRTDSATTLPDRW